MSLRKITIAIMAATLALWIGLNLYAYLANDVPGDTISAIIRDYTVYPIIPAVIGILCGHWFWNVKDSKKLIRFNTTMTILGPYALILIVWSVIAHNSDSPDHLHKILGDYPHIWSIMNIPVGRFTWPLLKSRKRV